MAAVTTLVSVTRGSCSDCRGFPRPATDSRQSDGDRARGVELQSKVEKGQTYSYRISVSTTARQRPSFLSLVRDGAPDIPPN